MALFLKDIYNETGSTYSLKLIAGEGGLGRIMSWIYISESTVAQNFLNGGELVITTGVNMVHDENWLQDFVSCYMKNHACGIIFNVGEYMRENQIDPEIIKLCNEQDFPLFVMPWNTSISNITHDYYDRLFKDSKDNDIINNTLKDLINQKGDPASNIESLQAYNYLEDMPYAIVLIKPEDFEKNHINNGFFQIVLRRDIALEKRLYQIFDMNRCYILVLAGDGVKNKDTRCQGILDNLHKYFPKEKFYISISHTVKNLLSISTAYDYANAALSLAQKFDRELISFDLLGIYQILLTCNDKDILWNFAEERLNKLIRYDKENQTNYVETLRYFLLFDGSIQKISAKMYCHRNTVNNRIRVIREKFHYDLDDMKLRMELMISYYIYEFFKEI